MSRKTRGQFEKRAVQQRLQRAGRSVTEALERRTLLTSVITIPDSIIAASVPQQLFAPGTSTVEVNTAAGINVVKSQFFRIVLKDGLVSSASAPNVDTALALYDADGNLLQKVDADNPNPGSETLSVTSASSRQLVLGVFSANLVAQPAEPVILTVNTPAVVQNAPLKIDPTSGQFQLLASSGESRFNSPSDVNYYPLDFANGGTSGTVTLQAPSPDTQFFATLFRQDTSGGAWEQIAGGSGAPVTLNVTPPSQLDLTDARYELAVAPLNFNSPAQPYEVDLSAGILGPASVAGQTTGSALAVAPTSAGTAGASASQAFSSATLFPFEAVDNGPVTITLQTTTAVPLLSLYDANGATLLGVSASQLGGDHVSLTIPATKGEQFIARAGDVSGSSGGQLTLTVSQAYVPTPLQVTGAVQQQSGLAVAPGTGGQWFRLTPTAGANYLVIQLTPDAGATVAPRITAVATGLSVVQASAAAGNTVVLPIDLSQASGPVDVYLAGASGSGTATFAYSALTIPRQIPLGQFATQALDVTTGALIATLPAPAAGQVTGVQFYELSPGQAQTFTAQASTGSAVLLLRYAQDGGILRLEDRALGAGSAAATLTGALQGTLMYGIAAVPLGGGGAGTIQFHVSSPTVPQGVGVSMAPNQIALPNQPPPAAPFFSQLKLVNQIITSPAQRDLFATLLPFDISSSPTLTFTPNTIGGPLAVKITVLDANNDMLNTFTTTAGQAFTSPALTSLTTADAGQTVRLLVEPVTGQALGDGIYNLEMDVATSDPNPFLATEPSFSFFRSLPPITSIPFGSSVPGTFSTSDPTTQFYSVVLPNTTTPFKIWTEDLDGTVNTDMKIYRLSAPLNFPRVFTFAEFDNEPPPSFDFFPADRSKVDAQVTVNNYHILDGEFTGNFAGSPNTIFIAVKNEQASRGQYRIHAGPVVEPLLGPGTPYQFISFGGPMEQLFIDPTTGVGTIPFNASVTGNNAVVLNTPHGLTNGTITLQVTAATGSDVQIHLYDATHTRILQEDALPDSSHVATFTLPQLAAASGYTLGIFALDGLPVNNVTLTCPVSTSSAPNKPSTTDTLAGGTTEAYVRAVPAPDGSFSDQASGRGASLSPVTLRKVAFYVSSAGPAHFSLSTSGVLGSLLSLYEEQQEGGEFVSVAGNLVDFVSQPGADGTYSFDAYLTPGTYVLKVVGPYLGPFHSTSITATTPAYDATHITLDPTSAQNDQPNLQTVDNTFSFYGTEFYELEAPGGVKGPLMLDVHNVANANSGAFDIGVFKKTGTSYTLVGTTTLNLNGTPPPMSVVLQTSDMPAPGDQYFIGVNRDLAATVTGAIEVSLGPSFMIPQPGLPDLVPQAIQLSPENGHTRVLVTVRNFGFGSAGGSHGLLTFSNYAGPSDLTFSGVGPFGSISYITDWSPGATTDTVSFVADSTNLVAESNENNNSTSVALSTVDPQAPTSSVALSDPAQTGEGATWGRYVSGVSGVSDHIVLSGTGGDIYQESIIGGPLDDFFTATGGSFPTSHTLDLPVDFGSFQPTSPASANVIVFTVIDAYGLKAPTLTQKVDVVPKPQFLTSVTFDPQARRYNLVFVHDVVNEQETLSQIFGFTVPVVGDKNNQFLVHVEADGTASLDPTQAVSLPLTGHILLDALGQSLYDESFDGSTKLTDHLTFTTRLDIDRHTLDATAASASLQLQNLQLLHFRSPSIKLFSFGLPDVASVDGSIKFGLDASLSAGVKLGIDPNILVDPLSLPDRFGVMSPTYIHPTITGTATAEGSVNVLGFDVASLSGTVALTLDATVGLDNNDPAKVFSFDDFFNHIAVKIGGDLKINLGADVAIIGNVWSYNHDFPFTLVDTTTKGIITQDPGGAMAMTVGQLQGVLSNPLSLLTNGIGPLDVPAPVVRTGTDLVGAYPIDPHPVIVIDPITGRSLTLQVVNASQTQGQTIGNLSFSQRNAGVWSAPATLSSGDVAEPNLALTHDNAASSTAAVVVYEATNMPGSPAPLTLNQKLDDTDIRFRYYNGASFGPEQSITNDSLLDTSPSVAFNASGQGVFAWVHNTNPAPMGDDGTYSRDTQQIDVAIWNPITKTPGPAGPLPVPFPNVANYAPSTYVDDSGRMYVVWINGADDSNALMYSTSTGGAWSAPQQLPITGLTPGGSFKNLSIGRDKLGRVDVVFSYRDPIAGDGSVHTLLLDRAATAATFAQPTGYEVIDHDANFSDIHTTNEPDGSLVAYWQKGDGVDNGVFCSSLSRSSASPSAPWTAPLRLTSTADLTMTPSLAVDTNGHLDVLFHQAVADGAQPAPPSPDPQVGVALVSGVGGSNTAQLPELTFSNGLFFPNQDRAVAGTNVTGIASILNRGAAAANVTIDSFIGLPTGGTLINTQQIMLAPGSTYNYSQAFPVVVGSQTYSVRVTSATGEAVTTDDDISAATLTGFADIAIASLTPSAAPQPGQPLTLTADVRNFSTVPVGAFDVTLYSGDPHFPQTAPTVISVVHVNGLASLGDLNLNFPVTLPSAPGQYIFTAVADSGGVISEAVKTNNSATFNVAFLDDPAVTSVAAAANGQISHNNVSVTANLANFGNVAVANVPVHLQVSRDGGAFAEVGVQNVSIGAQQTSQAIFQADGLAGDNVYRVAIDASVNAFDLNVFNNFGQTELVIQGIADLAMGSLSLSHPNPRQGSPLSVQGVINNIGLADADNVLAEVFAIPTAGGAPLAVGGLRLLLVPGLGQINLNLPVDTSQLLGSYTLVVQLNRLQELLETTASNNTASITTTFGQAITISPLVINDGGTQRSMVNKLTVTFNTAVTLGAGAITLGVYSGNDTSGLLSDASAALGTPTTSDGGFTWVIPILASTAFSDPTGSLKDWIFKAIVHSSLVTDSSKNALAGGDRSITFHRLFGDIDGNGVVNSADYFKFKAAFGSISAQANFNSDFDFDGNGKINSSDYFKFKANFGRKFTY